MPYKKRKQKCKQSDGDAGNYVLSYTDKKGKKHRACHTSKKKMQGQIAAIEAESEEIEGKVLEQNKAKTIKMTHSQLRQIIIEELAKLSPYKNYQYGVDQIPSASSAQEEIIGHT